MKGSRKRNACLGLLIGLVLPALAAAQAVPRTTSVREREFRNPDLYVPETTETLQQLPAPLADPLRGSLARLGVAPESIFFDSRTSRPNSLILHVPVIPGSGAGNRLSWSSRPPTNDADLGNEAWKGVYAYLGAHKDDLKIDLREVEESPRIGVFEGGNIIFIHARRVVGGIPVRDNSIGAAVNHGNLILLGLQKWADVNAARTPGVSARAARDAVAAYLRPLAVSRSLREPTLEFIPMAGPGSIEYRLAWVVTSKVEEDMGTWEALVDAGNGTVFALQDTNQYDSPSGVVSGGVYPISNDQRPPDGVEQPGWPMSFVDLAHGGVRQYADVGGNVGCIPGSISTALSGLFLKIVDDCGAINESGTGGIDLGSGPTASATDCTIPAGHSRGDTKSARSGYYELNRQIEKAQSHLGPGTPAGVWLRQQVTAEMNENSYLQRLLGRQRRSTSSSPPSARDARTPARSRPSSTTSGATEWTTTASIPRSPTPARPSPTCTRCCACTSRASGAASSPTRPAAATATSASARRRTAARACATSTSTTTAATSRTPSPGSRTASRTPSAGEPAPRRRAPAAPAPAAARCTAKAWSWPKRAGTS